MESVKNFIYDKPEWVILYLVIILCTGFRWFHIDGLLGYLADSIKKNLSGIEESIEYSTHELENSIKRIEKLLERNS